MSLPLAPASPGRAPQRTRPLPAWLAVLTDSISWFLAIMVLTLARYLLADDNLAIEWTPVLSNVALVSLLCIAVMCIGGWLSGLYRHRFVVGSLDELRALSIVAFMTWFAFTIVVLTTVALPRSVVLAIFPTVLMLMGGVRLVFRNVVETRSGPAGNALPGAARWSRGARALGGPTDGGGSALRVPARGFHRR